MSTISTKNASIPEALLEAALRLAESERRAVDDLVAEAVEGYLQRKRLQTLYAYGERQTRRVAIQEADVPEVVEQWRRANLNNPGI